MQFTHNHKQQVNGHLVTFEWQYYDTNWLQRLFILPLTLGMLGYHHVVVNDNRGNRHRRRTSHSGDAKGVGLEHCAVNRLVGVSPLGTGNKSL